MSSPSISSLVYKERVHINWNLGTDLIAFAIIGSSPSISATLYFCCCSEACGYFGNDAADRMNRFLKAWATMEP